MHKDYLGDSVYAEIENGMVKLTTDNGYGPSNTIHLEPEVIEALNQYVERIKSIYANAKGDTLPSSDSTVRGASELPPLDAGTVSQPNPALPGPPVLPGPTL